jgi:large-conductance mechanosensitive channel
MSDSNLSNVKTGWVLAILIGTVSLVIGFYFFNFNSHLLKNENWPDIFKNLSKDTGSWGTFGDYIGGILNPVIAAFAFYLIAKTYELQKRELEVTRNSQKKQIKLAALTALLNSNFTRINLLESEKLSLLESELRNPPPAKKDIDLQDLMRTALKDEYSIYEKNIKGRKEYIKDEITELIKKNVNLEDQIECFSKE